MLKLGADTAVASSHVRLLGVDISLDLSVDRHVSHVCAGCFYRQRVLNAAARVITGTQKFDRGLGQILHDQLH